MTEKDKEFRDPGFRRDDGLRSLFRGAKKMTLRNFEETRCGG